MQRVISYVALALSLASPLLCEQLPQSQEDMLRQLQEAVAALKEARSELQQSRRDIDGLRLQVEELRNKVDGKESAAANGTDERLANLEDEQQIQSSRIAQHDQVKVESASKYRVRLSGLVLFNAAMNNGSVNDQDVPNLAVRPSDVTGSGNISATMRQTQFTLEMFGPQVAGARTSASATFDFFGGASQTLDGSAMGLVRLRTGKVQFDWGDWGLSFGQDQPFISPRNPTSLASIGTPAMGYSGNMWTWTPQVVGRRNWNYGETIKFKTEFGLLDPLSGEPPYDQFSRKPEAGERSRVPALGMRQAFSTKVGDEELELGIGGYYSRHDYGYDRNIDSWAGTIDWSIPLSPLIQISGEFFRGRSLGGLWGGIGTSVVYTGPADDAETRVIPVNSIGGWTQLKLKPTPKLEFNAAFGQDNPFAKQVRQQDMLGDYAPSLRNQTILLNVIRRLRSNLLLSLEYRHLDTTSLSGNTYKADHVNAAVGVQF